MPSLAVRPQFHPLIVGRAQCATVLTGLPAHFTVRDQGARNVTFRNLGSGAAYPCLPLAAGECNATVALPAGGLQIVEVLADGEQVRSVKMAVVPNYPIKKTLYNNNKMLYKI